MKRRLILWGLPALLLLALAFTPVVLLTRGSGSDGAATDGDRELPEFVYSSPRVERAYRLAVNNKGLFSNVPCYCGCVNLAKESHRHLLDCFINDDGSYDGHAVGCSVCVDIAVDAVEWSAQGKTTEEIRSLVDEKYQSVGPPTGS